MPRTIALTGTELVRVQLQRDPSGQVQILAEYHLLSGTDVVRTVHRDLTPGVATGRRTGLVAAFEALARDVDAIEAL